MNRGKLRFQTRFDLLSMVLLQQKPISRKIKLRNQKISIFRAKTGHSDHCALKSRSDARGLCRGPFLERHSTQDRHQSRVGRAPKLESWWRGPYRVIGIINDVVIKIRLDSEARARPRIVHVDRVSPVIPRVMVNAE